MQNQQILLTLALVFVLKNKINHICNKEYKIIKKLKNIMKIY